MADSKEKSMVLSKGGKVKSLVADDSDMSKINELALEPLEKGQVYVFEVIACDNDIDRDYERFDEDALQQLSKLFVGRTIIKDHIARADNQFARVYDAEVVDGKGATSDGMQLRQLVVKCYTLDNEANAQIIGEIKAGIKKEVSVSFLPGTVTCSICGTDNRKHWCDHWNGMEYEGKVCSFTLGDIKDAYELSFVAIPAQRNAGTRKDYLLEGPEEQPEQHEELPDEKSEGAHEIELMRARIKLAQIELEMTNL